MPAHPHARATFLRSRSAPLGQNMSQIGRCTCARGPPARYLRVPRSKADRTQTSRFRAALFLLPDQPPASSSQRQAPEPPSSQAPSSRTPSPRPPAPGHQLPALSPQPPSHELPAPIPQLPERGPGPRLPAPSSEKPAPDRQPRHPAPSSQPLGPEMPRQAQESPGEPRQAQGGPRNPRAIVALAAPPKRRCCLQPLLRQMLMPQPQQPSPLLAPLIQTT